MLFCTSLLSHPLGHHSFSIRPNVRLDINTATTSSRQLAVSSHQEVFDAEEAAAFDAHDVSDAGIEAAMMEAAVMTADEIFRSHHYKKPSPTTNRKQTTDGGTTSQPHEDFVEHTFHFEKEFLDSSTNDVDEGHTAIESLANLIKDVDE